MSTGSAGQFPHGTKNAYYARKCRCEVCEAWHAYKHPARSFTHGTKHAYYVETCRCEACEAWHGGKSAVQGHGTLYAWYTKKCRCEVCIEWSDGMLSREDHGGERAWTNGCRCAVCQAAFPERALEYRSTEAAKRSTSRPERALDTSNAECLNVHPVTGERCNLDRHHERFRSVECVATDVGGVPLRWKAPASVPLPAELSRSTRKVAA